MRGADQPSRKLRRYGGMMDRLERKRRDSDGLETSRRNDDRGTRDDRRNDNRIHRMVVVGWTRSAAVLTEKVVALQPKN